MKTSLFSIAMCFICLLIACTQTDSKPKTMTKTLAIKDLEGSWVNAAYLEDVAKTRSPRLSFEKIGEIAQLNFEPAKAKGDTLLGELSYNGHEGGQYLVVLKAGRQPNSFRFGEYSEDLHDAPSDLTIEDGVLTITHNEPPGGGKVKAPFKYRRVSRTVVSLDEGCGLSVVKSLFFGNWMLTPAKGAAEVIQIDSLGKIYGEVNYTKLSIPTDYTGPESTQDDINVLDKTRKEPLSLHFKYKGAEVDFFETKGGKEAKVFNLSRF
jgi:hypothetical protein